MEPPGNPGRFTLVGECDSAGNGNSVELEPVGCGLSNFWSRVGKDCGRKPQPVVAPARIESPTVIHFDQLCGPELRSVGEFWESFYILDITY